MHLDIDQDSGVLTFHSCFWTEIIQNQNISKNVLDNNHMKLVCERVAIDEEAAVSQWIIVSFCRRIVGS